MIDVVVDRPGKNPCVMSRWVVMPPTSYFNHVLGLNLFVLVIINHARRFHLNHRGSLYYVIIWYFDGFPTKQALAAPHFFFLHFHIH